MREGRAATWIWIGRVSILSNPAMTTCVYQVSRSVLLSRRGNHPRTDSRNRSRHSRHSLANRRRNHGKRGKRGNRDSHRNRAKRPVRRSEPLPRFPCRRHRTWRG